MKWIFFSCEVDLFFDVEFELAEVWKILRIWKNFLALDGPKFVCVANIAHVPAKSGQVELGRCLTNLARRDTAELARTL